MLLCEAVAHYLHDAQVGPHFGVLGEATIAIATALHERGVPYVHARREDAAVSMADGWARRTERIGLCSVTKGPGLTNAITSLVEAARNRTPLVMLTGVSAEGDMRDPQRIDAKGLAELSGAGWRQVRSPELVAEDVAAALRDATVHRRPCVLAVPSWLLYLEVGPLFLDGTLPFNIPFRSPTVQRVRPPKGATDLLTEALMAAERPLLLVGRGAVLSGATEEVAHLAEASGAAIATTLSARGELRGHPAHVGICGSFSSRSGAYRIQTSDVVVALGCSLNEWTTSQGELLESAKVFQIDIDPAAQDVYFEVANFVLGDVKSVLQQILPEIAERRPSTDAPPVADAAFTISDSPLVNAPGDRLHALDVLRSLSVAMPAEAVHAFDAGNCVMDAIRVLEPASSSKFIFANHGGAVGLGLGTAIGASFADPDVWTVLVVGDGALAMSAQELDTVRSLALPLVIVVLDDGAFGAEVHYCEVRALPPTLAYTPNGNSAEIARGMGIEAYESASIDEFEKCLSTTFEGELRPVLIRVSVDSHPISDWFAQFSANIERVPGWTGGT